MIGFRREYSGILCHPRSRSSQNQIQWWSLVVLCSVLAWRVLPSFAAEPSELLKFVGDDVGVCVEIPELSKRLTAIEASPLFQRLRQTPFFEKWLASNDFRKLRAAVAFVESLADKPLRQLTEELFGKSVVIAVFPTPEKDPMFLLLTRTASSDNLKEAISVWNQLEPIKTTQVNYLGTSYVRRARLDKKRPGGETQCYWTSGQNFFLSNREEAIRKAIELSRQTNDIDAPNLYRSSVFQESRLALSGELAASFFLNPRAWDREIVASGTNRFIAETWQKCQSVALGIRIDRGVVLESIVRFSSDSDQAISTDVPPRTPADDSLFARIPDRAFLAWHGQWDSVRDLPEQLVSYLSKKDRNDWRRMRRVVQGLLLGHDFFDDVLRQVGSDYVAFVGPRSVSDSAQVPFEGLVGVTLAQGAESSPPEGKQASTRDALDNLLNTSFNLLAAVSNAKTSEHTVFVQTERRDEYLMRSIVGLDEFEPTYVFAENLLVLATARETAMRFLKSDATHSLAASSEYRAATREFSSATDQVLFVSIPTLRDLLNEDPRTLFGPLLGRMPGRAESFERKSALLKEIVNLFDAAFLAVDTRPDQLRLTLGSVLATDSDD